MDMRTIILSISILFLTITACKQAPRDAIPVSRFPDIFPDYRQIDVPVNIAPLNFKMKEKCREIFVEFKGKKSSLTVSGDDRINIPEKKWHELLAAHTGNTINVTVFTKDDEGWKQYQPFMLFVRNEPVDPWLVYRLIAPGYQVWSKMGIYQRSLSDFSQEVIADNTLFPGACMNCHSFRQNNPDQMMFHLRSPSGGTMLIQGETIQKLNTKTENTISGGTYPCWHPSGNYIGFPVNKIFQFFHALEDKRIEVADSASDLVVYDIRKNEMIHCQTIASADQFETFPVFSPDGKSLIFCSSKALDIPDNYNKVKYNLYRIDFDPESATFGNRIDTLINAEKLDKSISFPRVSPDGRFLMFTMSAYGNFFIWHKDADLYLYDIKNRNYRAMNEVNSEDTESYHSWSSNSRWFVFSSRRIDALYTRPFLAYIGKEGTIGKPFLLPQQNPDFYLDLMESFNIPEFVTKKVKIDPTVLEKVVMGEKGTQVGYRKLGKNKN